jgi:predicted nuclease of restriction endonuclease-like RecB superfamily
VSRRSSHEIVLSDVERAALERVAGALTAPFREVQRARIVLDAAAGLPDVQIAARRDCTIKTVGKWRKRFGERRLEGLSDTKRVGRPRRFPPGAGGRGQGGRV